MQSYLEKIKTIQTNLLEFIEENNNSEEKYQNLIKSLDDHKVKENQHELELFVHLLVKVADNYYRTTNFFDKIEQILTFLKESITEKFTNIEIFKLFSSNKRILLFLIDEKMMTIDERIASIMQDGKYKEANYPDYFSPEMKPFKKQEAEKDAGNIYQRSNPVTYPPLNPPIMMQPMNNMMMYQQNNPMMNQYCNIGMFPPQFNPTNIPRMVPLQNYPMMMQPMGNPGAFPPQNMPMMMQPVNGQPVFNPANNQGQMQQPVQQRTNQEEKQVKKESSNENTEKEKTDEKDKMPDEFYEKRKIGENDNQICEIIRRDSIDEFMAFVMQYNINLNSEIRPSIYETNAFLLKYKKKKSYDYRPKKQPSLICYAAFFGSIKIFKYMLANKAFIISSDLQYAIHGKNSEIIHLVEKSLYEFTGILYDKCLKQAVKCHDNHIVDEVQNIFSSAGDKTSIICTLALRNYNFAYIENLFLKSSFPYLCKYDYYTIVEMILSQGNIDVNHKLISLIYF